MNELATRITFAAAIVTQLTMLSSVAEARAGRGAAFVGGAAVGAAAANSRNNYYYGAPVYVAPAAPAYRCY